jgi:hypothetical protein
MYAEADVKKYCLLYMYADPDVKIKHSGVHVRRYV